MHSLLSQLLHVCVRTCTTSSYGSVPACGRSRWTQERCQEMRWTHLHTGHVVYGELKINHLFQLSERVAQGCYKGDGITFEPKDAPMEVMIKNWYINDGRALHHTSYRFTIWGPRSVLMEHNIDFTEYHGLVLTDLLFDVLVRMMCHVFLGEAMVMCLIHLRWYILHGHADSVQQNFLPKHHHSRACQPNQCLKECSKHEHTYMRG